MKQFSEDFKAAKTKNLPMLTDLLEGNECKPIVTQHITLRENRDKILKDYDYCCHSNGKRQNEMGYADSGTDIPWKIIKMESVIEPLDTNLTIDFVCLIVKLSKLMLLTVSDLLLKMTTKNIYNPFRPRTRV